MIKTVLLLLQQKKNRSIVSDKEKYIRFCESGQPVPLFLQPWWMDAVCSRRGGWEVFLYEPEGEIVGALVCHVVKRLGLTLMVQPMLTQYNGVWLNYEGINSANAKIHFEKKAMAHLIGRLEEYGFDYFNLHFPPDFTNWLPFRWHGFQQTTRYTYLIDDISDPQACFNAFGNDKKARIKKARRHLRRVPMSGEEFYDHLARYRQLRGERVVFAKDFFLRLHNAALARNRGKVIAVADDDGQIHAALFLVWDNERCYNLMTTIDPRYNSFGGSSLMFYEAIKFVADKVTVFDFEGSMSEPIERSFARFGTMQQPYFNLRKANSIPGKIVRKWMERN